MLSFPRINFDYVLAYDRSECVGDIQLFKQEYADYYWEVTYRDKRINIKFKDIRDAKRFMENKRLAEYED